ncbi:MAG: hypothetical protein ACLU99_01710 [Alphaproteobacteria bacterium]
MDRQGQGFFDNIPPWSLYKVFTGISWLLALSALVKGGTPVSTALRACCGATPAAT